MSGKTQESKYQEKVGIDLVCCMCQCPFMMTVLVFVGMLTAPISGEKYFTFGQPGFEPTCRAVVHAVDDAGTEVPLGEDLASLNALSKKAVTTQDDITAFEKVFMKTYFPDLGLSAIPQNDPVLGKQFEERMGKFDIVTMDTSECKLIVVGGKMMELEKIARISMPNYCGDPDEDSWHVGDAGGVWVTPIIMGAILWLFLRTWAMVFPIMVAVITQDEHLQKWTFVFMTYGVDVFKILYKWQAYAMFAPITTLKVSKDCPQVLTSFYSGHTQIGLACSWFGSVACGLCPLGVAFLKGHENAMLGSVGGIVCALISWAIIATTYYVFIMTTCGWTFWLNLSLDFSLDWETFDYAYEVQVTKILLFVLNVLDCLDFALKTAHGAYRCLKP